MSDFSYKSQEEPRTDTKRTTWRLAISDGKTEQFLHE